MLRFLDDASILKAVQELIKGGERIDLAVAYWGMGAVESLGIDACKPTRIICDLLSGGCNPHEIEKLRALPRFTGKSGVEVRHLEGLHAKVYWTDQGGIVGSANASANGLGDERMRNTIEAAIHTNDEDVSAHVAAWFNKMWTDSKKITTPMMVSARAAWLRKRPIADPNSTVLKTLRDNPDWFRQPVWVTYYNTYASDAAEAKFNSVKEQYYSPRELQKINHDDMPMYDFEIKHSEGLKGSFVLDMSDKKIYEVIEILPYSKKNCIVLLKRIFSIIGLRFPVEERSKLRRALTVYMKAQQIPDFDCGLNELVGIIDVKALTAT